MAPSRWQVEVVVVGGGVAGSALAAVLARRGHAVALIDPRETAAPDFRAEKLTGPQVAALRRLGIAGPVLAAATPIGRLRIARFGRLVEDRRNDELGLDYATLVDALRSMVPATARRIGRAAQIEADAAGARVTLGDGSVVAARLAVLATGLGKAMLGSLGIGREEVARDLSLAIGFDLVPVAGAPPTAALTYFGEHPADRAAYLTLFPIGSRLRANLFTYHHRDEAWVAGFRKDPLGELASLMPGLASMLPQLVGASDPLVRPIHLHAAVGHRRAGVVLIGDAFANTCPTGGTGVAKALNDVERLADMIPGWLATPGLGRDKVASFYDDPRKRAGDADARAMVCHARSLALDQGLYWTLHRHVGFHAQQLRARVRRPSPIIGRPAGMVPEMSSRN